MPRSRTRGAPFTSLPTYDMPSHSIWATCAQSTEVISGYTASLPWGSFERFSDDVIPGFHDRVNRGEVFFNPMSQIIEKRDGVRGIGAIREKTTPTAPCGQFNRVRTSDSHVERTLALAMGPIIDPVYVNPFPLFSEEEINDLLIEHSTRVLSQRGREGFDLFESLAEVDKTAKLLPGLLGNIRNIVPPRNKLPRKIKNLASAWLGLRYGLMPLIRDVDNIVEGLKKPTGPLRKTTRSNSGELRRTRYFTETWAYSSLIETVGVSCVDEISVRVMSLDEYDIAMLNNIGFSGKNLLTLPWELIPYSFVVDWFANIGDFVGSIAPSPGVKQLGSACTISRTTRSEANIVGASAPSGWSLITPGFGSYKPFLFTKNRATTLPSPRIVIKNDFRFNNLTRVLDATGLLLKKIR